MTTSERILELVASTCRRAVASMLEIELNKLVTADADAIDKLIEMRVPCNTKIETDTLAVPFALTKESPLQIGVLGLLNLVAGMHGLRIVAHYDDTSKKLTKFTVVEIDRGSTDTAVQSEHRPELQQAASGNEGSCEKGS